MSREKLAKDRERIRNRMATTLLSYCLGNWRLVELGLVEAMAEAEILTKDEFQEFARAKDHRKQLRILRGLATKYAKLAKPDHLGEPKTKIYHVKT